MPLPKRAPPPTLFTCLSRSSPRRSIRATCRAGNLHQTRCESTEQRRPEEGRSFKGQLYESTSTRLQKERLERARFADERNQSASGRNWSITFCMYPNCPARLPLTCICNSGHSNRHLSLLPRHIKHNQTVHSINDPFIVDNTP